MSSRAGFQLQNPVPHHPPVTGGPRQEFQPRSQHREQDPGRATGRLPTVAPGTKDRGQAVAPLPHSVSLLMAEGTFQLSFSAPASPSQAAGPGKHRSSSPSPSPILPEPIPTRQPGSGVPSSWGRWGCFWKQRLPADNPTFLLCKLSKALGSDSRCIQTGHGR